MTTLQISDIQRISAEYYNFKNAYDAAGSALSNVISIGTSLYNDAALVSLFPTSSQAYKTYLVNVQSAINTFIAGLPAEPPLSG